MASALTPTAPSKVSLIVSIIDAALAGLTTVVPGAALATAFIGIFQNAASLYQQETGQPFSVANIPIEQPVP